jgi:hypothetical protein
VAATVFSLLLLALLIVPVVLLAGSMVEGVQTLTAHFKDRTAVVPPPPPSVESWPIIGGPLKSMWDLASTDLPALASKFAPQIKAALPGAAFSFCRSWRHSAAAVSIHLAFRIPSRERSSGL